MKTLLFFCNRRSGQPDTGMPQWTSTRRAGVLVRLVLGIAVMLVAGRLGMWAAECGSSSNTYWTKTLTPPCAGVATAGTNVYWTDGLRISHVSSSGGNVTSRDFPLVTLGQPLVMERAAGGTVLVVAGSDGFVYSLNKEFLVSNWSRSVKRPTCAADTIEAAPVVQRRQLSDTNFQADVDKDLVIVGTSYKCGATTVNRVYALDGATGNTVWAHNGTAAYQYDRFTGLGVDYGRNTVYATTYKVDPMRTQNTVIAINTLSGARRWGMDLGSIESEPVVANGGVFVVTRAGVLYKLDPDTGATMWQTNIAGSGALVARPPVVDAAFNTIYVTDSAGVLHAVLDTCTGATVSWSTSLSGALVSTPPALLTVPGIRKLYVGANDGRVYQLNPNTGAPESYASIPSLAAAMNVVAVTHLPGFPAGSGYRLLAAGGDALKEICIPWTVDGVNHSLIGGNGKSLLAAPNCSDPNAPASGLVVSGNLGTMTSAAGQSTTRFLTLGNSTCYPFQCASLLGNLPPGLGASLLASTNGTTAWDTNSFLAEATVGLPMHISLTVTSAIPGTYLTTLTPANAGNVHTTVTLTNIVVASPILAIALNGGQAELSWTNSVGFQLECAPRLAFPLTWQTITEGISNAEGLNHYPVTDTATTTNRFYRLHKP